MKTLKSWIAGGLLMLVLTPAAASAMGLELSLGAWNQTPSGDVSFNGSSGNDNLSIKDNLRYDERSRILGRVKFTTPCSCPTSISWPHRPTSATVPAAKIPPSISATLPLPPMFPFPRNLGSITMTWICTTAYRGSKP